MFDEKEDSNADCHRNSIGREVAILRALLNMTQQQFAEVISSSRVTINKLENIEDSSKISSDLAFRLYFLTQKIIENKYLSELTRIKAKELQRRIEEELL